MNGSIVLCLSNCLLLQLDVPSYASAGNLDAIVKSRHGSVFSYQAEVAPLHFNSGLCTLQEEAFYFLRLARRVGLRE